MTFAVCSIWNNQKILIIIFRDKTKYKQYKSISMNTKEIINTVAMYNRIMAALKECKKVNEASNYGGDLLWVECNNGTHYTNELGDFMPNELDGEYYCRKGLEEIAAKFAELCLAVGCSPSDIYTSY